MKIVNIFVIINESLLAVQFDNNDSDEFSHLFQAWNDIEYLKTFFLENEQYLKSGFYKNISIEQAIKTTLKDAEELENFLIKTAEKGKTDPDDTLQTIFKPLNNNEYAIPLHQKSKLKGSLHKSWLRIYAIRIAPNLFVISGGAIKLTYTMEESEHLQKELHKLEVTKNYLLEIGLLDENDYEYLEI